MQHSSAEELPETAVKAWKRHILKVANESAIVNFFPFCSHEYIFFLLTIEQYTDWACAGQKYSV